MIGIVDYNMGNLASVINAFAKVGADATLESNPSKLSQYDKLILPGVGAYGDAMEHLKENGMDQAVIAYAKTGKPLLGICLGMQLLFESSEEFGAHKGLGLIPGKVVAFDETNFDHKLKVPHMGWNELFVQKETPLFKNLHKDFYLYFVHSYHIVCEDKYAIGKTHYGYEFVSAVQNNNIYGIQPHPEKSHDNGLKIIENFSKTIGIENNDNTPAIDLKDGKAVRLSKGLMASAKIYSDEPWQVAKRFEELGSEWVHLVDLNGAFAGKPENLEQIKQIRKHCNLKLELGGGIRDEETIKMYLDIGIDRLILGSIAVKDAQFVKDMAAKYPIVVIDAIDGMVAVEGWAETSNMKATDLAREFAACGVQAIICTDVGRDGMMTGVNVDFTLEIKKASGLETIASGGLKDMTDINALIKAGIDGTIVGKAFYEGTLDLEEAFKVANER